MIDHVTFGVADVEAARAFYDAALGPLEIPATRGGEYLWVPSLKALRALGEGAFLRPPSSFRHGRPQTVREVAQWAAGTAFGLALAPLAAAMAFATGRRPVHARGAAYEGTLEVPTPPDERFDGTVLDLPGRHRVVVRLSRGFSRPLRDRDVHGVAIPVLATHNPADDRRISTIPSPWYT